jgi:hypothetical protein
MPDETYEPWPDGTPPSITAAIASDGGSGYAATFRAIVDGQTWARTLTVGPEGWAAGGWVDETPPIAGVALTTPTLSATFENIGISASWAETGDTVTRVRLYARAVGEAIWREDLEAPVVRQSGFAPAAYGSIRGCLPGTTYEVRIRYYAASGTRSTWTGTVTTRAEDIPDAATLVPTHYVRATGSDAANGLTAGTAWKTIAKANGSAPAGAVIELGPGHHVGLEAVLDSGTRFSAITWKAQYAWHLYPTQPELWTIVEGSTRAGPLGNGVVTEAPWTAFTTIDGAVIWKWANAAPTGAVLSLGHGPTRDAAPQRAFHWKQDALRTATPAGWAALLMENRTLRHGYCQSGSDLYCRLPGDVDPNTRWWTGSVGAGLGTSKPDFRATGLVFRGWYRAIQNVYGGHRMVVDRCRFECCTGAVSARGMTPSTYPTDCVVQDNVDADSGTWSLDQVNAPSAPWDFVKDQIKLADGSLYPTGKLGGNMEGSFVGLRAGRRWVIRRNDVSSFNGVVGWQVSSAYDRFACSEIDVHDNVFHGMADDGTEPEGYCVNWRIWNNHFERTLTCLSTGPVHLGPIYFWGNTAYRTGKAGLAADLDGLKAGAASVFFKFSRASSPQARIYVRGNTLWTDEPGVSGGDNYASGNALPEAFDLRGNIIRTTRYGFAFLPGAGYVERENQFGCADPAFGMRQIQPGGSLGWDQYRAASSQGEGSCPIDLHDVARLDSQFVDAQGGDLRLVPGGAIDGLGAPM